MKTHEHGALRQNLSFAAWGARWGVWAVLGLAVWMDASWGYAQAKDADHAAWERVAWERVVASEPLAAKTAVQRLASLADGHKSQRERTPGKTGYSLDEGVLTLERALDRAMRQNTHLKIAKRRLMRAEVLAKKSWAVLAPSISANGRWTWNNQEITIPSESPPAEDILIQKQSQLNASLQADWVLLSARSYPALRMAKAQVAGAQMSFAETEALIQTTTTYVYYSAFGAQKQAEIRQRALAVADESLRLAKARFEVGSGLRLEVLRARSEVERVRGDALVAQNAARYEKYALAVWVGLLSPDGKMPTYRLQKPPVEPKMADAKDAGAGSALAEIFDRRLDLKTANENLRSARFSRAETWGRIVPALAAFGQWDWSDAAGFAGNRTTWRVGLAIQWSLFDRGLNIFEGIERGHDVALAELAIGQKREAIAQEWEQMRLRVQDSEARHRVARKVWMLADETADFIKEQYRLGAASQLDLLDANRRKADAEVQMILTETAVSIARILLRSTQDLSPARIQQTAQQAGAGAGASY